MSAPLGSKANPSKFEVYKDLPDDEPYFVIRARDPLSSALVELHAYIGAGQSGSAHNKLAEIMAILFLDMATSIFWFNPLLVSIKVPFLMTKSYSWASRCVNQKLMTIKVVRRCTGLLDFIVNCMIIC